MLDFDEKLGKAETSDEIKKMKVWLFQEQVKIQVKQEELQDLSRELQEEKRTLERERNALDVKIKAANKRFNDNEVFMAKKQKIIEDAFGQLALDRKALQCERMNFEYEKSHYKRQKMSNARSTQFDSSAYDGSVFFRGVDNELALRKRYRDLLKIFHPDNMCGDTKTLLLIQTEYENLRRKYEEA